MCPGSSYSSLSFYRLCSFSPFFFPSLSHSAIPPHSVTATHIHLNVFCFTTAMMDALTSKTVAWEKERGIEFTYDGVSIFTLSV